MTNDSFSLEARNIAYAYPGGEPVFSDISLSLRPGEIVCILGPNGVGKTTILNCLANLNPLSGGEIFINGKNARFLSPREAAQNIGYVPQMIMPSFDFSVLDYVVTGCAPRMGTFEKPRQEHFDIAHEAIREMGIEYLEEKSYMHISGGERQQVAIARALAQKPKFILMDEPTAHLDYGNQIKVLLMIRRLADKGFGILITTHNPDHSLLLGGRVAILERGGSLKFGDTDVILTEELLTSLYGTPLKLVNEPAVSRKICAAPRLEDIEA